MSKRTADNYLTHDNWDQEDEKDEVGVFKNASESELQKRTIIKAKRKNPGASGLETSKNAFSGFSFGSVSSSSDSGFAMPTTFTFGSKVAASASKAETSAWPAQKNSKSEESETKTNGSSGSETNVASNAAMTSITNSTRSPAKATTTIADNDDKINSQDGALTPEKTEDADEEYLRQMKLLNQSFCKWISECIAKNPDCILTPCFDDYTKYVENLDRKYPCVGSAPAAAKKQSDSPSLAEEPAKDEKTEKPQIKESPIAEPEEPKKELPSTFSFLKPESSSGNKLPVFGVTLGKTGGFTFGTSAKEADPKGEKNESESKNESMASSSSSSSTGFSLPKFNFGSNMTGSFTFGASTTTAAATSVSATTSSTNPGTFTFGTGSSGFPGSSGFSSGSGFAGFGSSSSSSGTTSFNFGTSSGFPTFGKNFFSKPAEANGAEGKLDQTAAAGGDDEAYEPPKAEVVENSEDGAFHTVRCKLYHKKLEKFEERGVGFLYLKPNGAKTQLLVRTDTALGNILLNINVEKLMPVSLQGKNNITIVCVPNPPVDPKSPGGAPIPMLIRVKTEDDAKALYEKISKCQADME